MRPFLSAVGELRSLSKKSSYGGESVVQIIFHIFLTGCRINQDEKMIDLRKLKESQYVEFKSSFTKEVIISLAAFANTRGGKVVIGTNDKGKVSGIDIGPETEQRYLNEIKTATYPQIIPHSDVHKTEGKTILVFEINEYPVKPVAYKNRYYKRVRNSNHLLNLDEIVDLQNQSLNVSYDAHPLDEDLSSLSSDLIVDFVKRVNSRG